MRPANVVFKDRMELIDERTLVIKDARVSDGGTFICNAYESRTRRNLNATSYVLVEAKIVADQDEEGDNRPNNLQLQKPRPLSSSNNNKRHKNKMTGHSQQSHPSAGFDPVVVTLTEITELSEELDDSRSEPNVVLKWDVLRGADLIEKFHVLYSIWPNDESTHEVHDHRYFELDSTIPSKARSYTLGNSFGDAKRYKFQIEAITGKSGSFKSNPMMFDNHRFLIQHHKNLEAKSMRPVLDDVWEVPVKSNRNNSMAAGLRWRYGNPQHDGDFGALPEGFKIYYRRQGHESNYTIINVPRSGKHAIYSYLLKDLQLDCKYEFKVCAYNGEWTSKLSNPVFMSKTSRDKNAETVVWMQQDSQAIDAGSTDSLTFMENRADGHSIAAIGQNDSNSQQAFLVESHSNTDSSNHLVYSAIAIILASLLLFMIASITFCTYRLRRSRRLRNRCHPHMNTGYRTGRTINSDHDLKSISRYLAPNDGNAGDLFIPGMGKIAANEEIMEVRGAPFYQQLQSGRLTKKHKISTPRSKRNSFWKMLFSFGKKSPPSDSFCRLPHHPCYCGSTVSGHPLPSNATTAPTSCWTSADEDPTALLNNHDLQHIMAQHQRCYLKCNHDYPTAGHVKLGGGTIGSKTSNDLQQQHCCFSQHQRCSLARCTNSIASGVYIDPSQGIGSKPSSIAPDRTNSSEAPLLPQTQAENFYHTLNCSMVASPPPPLSMHHRLTTVQNVPSSPSLYLPTEPVPYCYHCATVATMASIQRRHSRCCPGPRCDNIALSRTGLSSFPSSTPTVQNDVVSPQSPSEVSAVPCTSASQEDFKGSNDNVKQT
ncbi:hypothetical protein ACOME3_009594 [Neoechinorhynchus agilis]